MSGLVIRKNLFPSPMFSTQSTIEGVRIVSKSDGVLVVEPSDPDSRGYIDWNIGVFPTRFQATLHAHVKVYDDWPAAFPDAVWPWENGGWTSVIPTIKPVAGSDLSYELTGTIPAGTHIGLRLWVPARVELSQVNIEDASTFDESLPFFYYGTMPDPRSAS